MSRGGHEDRHGAAAGSHGPQKSSEHFCGSPAKGAGSDAGPEPTAGSSTLGSVTDVLGHSRQSKAGELAQTGGDRVDH